MRNAALEKLIWVLIYGGLLSGILGLFMALHDADPADWYTGEVLGLTGGIAVLAGVVLIWFRSRRRS